MMPLFAILSTRENALLSASLPTRVPESMPDRIAFKRGSQPAPQLAVVIATLDVLPIGLVGGGYLSLRCHVLFSSP